VVILGRGGAPSIAGAAPMTPRTRPAEFPAQCRSCPGLPITPHKELRLVKVVQPGGGPAFGRLVEAQCGLCHSYGPKIRPPDAEGWRRLRQYRKEKGYA
jgi:hypothetical protein